MANSQGTTQKLYADINRTINTTASRLITLQPNDIRLLGLTRSQRLQLGHLVEVSGVEAIEWVKEAVDFFLKAHAPVYLAEYEK